MIVNKNNKLRFGTVIALLLYITKTPERESSTVSQISKMPATKQPRKVGLSGERMDRRVEKKTSYRQYAGYAAAGVAALVFMGWLYGALTGGRSLSVDSQRIIVSDVTKGVFEDFIPLRGRLVRRYLLLGLPFAARLLAGAALRRPRR